MKSIKDITGLKNIRESFKTRQVKYGGYAVLLTLAVIVGLLLLNLMLGQFSPQVDMTSSRLFSLSEQTLQVLDTVKTPVRFFGLWKPGEEAQEIRTVINLCLSRNSNISLELVDPDKNPGFVARYDREKKGIPRGSLIVDGEKGFRVIGPYDMYDITQSQSGPSVTGIAVERRITNALLFVGSGVTPVVYEITGHNEIPLSNLKMQEVVERENYTLKPLNLLMSDVPSDASALILNFPRKDLFPAEVEKLLNYLEKGGRFLVLADYNIGEVSNLNEVLASYGLQFDFGIVFESDLRYYFQDPRNLLPDAADHEITRPLADKTKTPVVLVQAMPLSLLDARRRTIEVTPLLATSEKAFLRTNLDETSANKMPSDISGPLFMGAAVKDPSWIQGNDPQARIVAIGCANLLPLVLGGIESNRDLFMNSFAWLQEKPENISIRSKSLTILPMRLNTVQVIIFGALFIFIIPVAFFVTGFVIWLKRRHL